MWRRSKTTFEPTKAHAMLVSNSKRVPKISTLEFDGVVIKFEQQLKIVGVIYDSKLNWSAMAAEMDSRVRSALGFLYRLRYIITPHDMGIIYKYSVRSKMEFGLLSYKGAAKTHLAKLDGVQHRAEVLSNKSFQSLEARRTAACFDLLCKILDQKCVQPMTNVFSDLQVEEHSVSHRYNTSRSNKFDVGSLRLTDMENKFRWVSLDTFRRSFICDIRHIFDTIPNSIKELGREKSWSAVMKAGQRFLTNI